MVKDNLLKQNMFVAYDDICADFFYVNTEHIKKPVNVFYFVMASMKVPTGSESYYMYRDVIDENMFGIKDITYLGSIYLN